MPRLTISNPVQTEGTGGPALEVYVIFDLRLSEPSDLAVTVDYATADGTAKAGEDYEPQIGRTLTIPAGEINGTLRIRLITDSVTEKNETFSLLLTNPVNATLAATESIAVIVDDDRPQVSVRDVSVSEGNSGTQTVSVPVMLSAPSPFEVTVRYDTADGSTVAGSDYLPAGGLIKFPPNSTNQSIPITVRGDILAEENEFLIVRLFAPVNATLGQAEARVNILDDDTVPFITISDGASPEGDNGLTEMSFEVRLSRPNSHTVLFTYTTEDGAAFAGSDYVAKTETVVFDPGEVAKTITVQIMGDTTPELSESFQIVPSDPINAVLGTKKAVGTIVDDDGLPFLSIENASVVEGNVGSSNVLSFNLKLSHPAAVTVTANYATVNGTAIAGIDYVPAQQRDVSFATGEFSKTVRITVIGDNDIEANETFTLQLSGITNATFIGTTAIGTILNDDGPRLSIVSEGPTEERDAEEAISRFRVILEGSPTSQVTVNYAAGSQTAIAGEDFVAGSGTLTFHPGETNKPILIPVLGDLINEPLEFFAVKLSSPAGATLLQDQALGIITDNDPPLASINDVRLVEGNDRSSLGRFAVTLSTSSSSEVRIPYTVVPRTATADLDFVRTNGVLVIPAGDFSGFIDVTILGDRIPEDAETFAVTLQNSTNAVLLRSEGIGTIVDDDEGPRFSVRGASANENDKANFLVQISSPSEQTISVSYDTIDGTAQAGVDFQGVSGTLVFAPGTPPAQLVSVPIFFDALDEPDEFFTLVLSNPVHATLEVASARATIIDADAPPTLSAISDQTIPEDTITTPLDFVVADRETAASNLVVTASSSNPALLPETGIAMSGDGPDRTITLAPAADQFGTATVTLVVTDNAGLTSTSHFDLIVSPVNDPPLLDPITDITINEDTPTQITLTGIRAGPPNESQILRITAVSSNPLVIPAATIEYLDPSTEAILRVVPTLDANGDSIITVTVYDDESVISSVIRRFKISVAPVNDAPAVVLLSPLDGARFTPPVNIPLSVNVLDVDGTVSAVQYFQGTTLIGEATAPPFSTVWSNVPAGNYKLTARAFDDEGAGRTSTFILISVIAPNAPPVLSPIPAQTTQEDRRPGDIVFQVADDRTPASNLVVTAVSSNPGLVSQSGIALSTSGTNQLLVLNPERDQSGEATITVTATDPEGLATTNRFDLTVIPVNDPPTLDPVSDLFIGEDAGTQSIPLTGISSGAANEIQTLRVTAASSNPSLIPPPQVTYSSPNLTGALRFTPAPNVNGSAIITVTVDDGGSENSSTNRSFTVSVASVNDAPSVFLSAPTNGAQFTAPASILISAAAEDFDGVVARVQFFQGVTFVGEATAPPFNTLWSNVPAGTYTVTSRAIDNEGLSATSVPVSILVLEPNKAPMLSPISAQTTREDTPSIPITFQVTDSQTPAANLVVLATSLNPSLLPPSGISLSGNGTNRTLILSPARDQSGTAAIILTVSDPEGLAATNQFDLTVTSVNDPPTIDPVSNVVINEDAGIQTIQLTGISSGATNEVQTLRVTAGSGNPSLIPQPQVDYTSPNPGGTLRFTPAPNGNGSVTITVTVDDGDAENSTTNWTFTVSVRSVNDAPSVVLSAPTNGAQFTAPANIVLSASVRDDDGFVSRVQYFQGGTLIGEATAPPFDVLWSGVSGGSYTLLARAIDNEGLASTSDLVSISVIEPNGPPVLSPIQGQTTREDTPSAPIPFQVSDIHTPASNLVVLATSLNPGLLPRNGITLSGIGTNRTLVLNPVRDRSGTVTVILTAADPEGLVSTNRFDLTVTPVNDVPTLDPLSNLTIDEDAGTQTIQLTGISTGATNETIQTLRVTAVSSNPALIPPPRVDYANPAPTGTLRLAPAPDANGSATITVTVDDGEAENATMKQTFVVSVSSINDAPTVAVSSPTNGARFITPASIPLSATAHDIETSVSTVQFFEGPNLVVEASAAPFDAVWRNVPAGDYTLTARAIDSEGLASTSAPISIVVFGPPVLSPISAQTTLEDTPSPPILFQVSDIHTPASNLVLAAISSNPSLLPPSGINLSGNGANRTLILSPARDQSGVATILLTAADSEGLAATNRFDLTVVPVNDAPTLDTLTNLVLNEDAGSQTIPLSGISSGAANEIQTLRVSAESNNRVLIAQLQIDYASPDSVGTLRFTPGMNASGSATITVTVDDGGLENSTTSQSFTIVVTPLNDAPMLDTLTNLVLNEDAGLQSIPLTGIGSGAADETQTLRVSAESNNPALIAQLQIDYASPNPFGTLRFTPVPDANGSATITITVDDGGLENSSTTRSFTVLVTPVNDSPSVLISSPANGAQFIAPASIALSATVRDVDGFVSNVQFYEDASLVAEASSPGFSALWTNVPTGSYTLTARATDNEGLASTSAPISIIVFGPPVISAISDQTSREDTSGGPISFQISDAHTPASNLVVLAQSADPRLLPQSGITISGNDTNRTLLLRPAPDRFGVTAVFVTATDAEGMVATNRFDLTVTPVNDPPTLDALSNLTLNEDAGLQSISLSGIGSGAANEIQTLRITAVSSNPELIPSPQIDYLSPSSAGTLRFTPAADTSGSAAITVTVDDGESENSQTIRVFTVSVTPVNDAPTVFVSAPSTGAQFISPASVSLAVSVRDIDGFVSKVQYFQDATLVAETASSPFDAVWTNVPAGNFTLTARAVDNEGLASTSAPVSIVVFGPPVLSPIPNQTTREDTPSSPISFQVSDLHTPTSNLVVLALSSNPGLLPPSGISLSGNGTNRTLILNPARDQSGGATIVLTALDSEGLAVTNRFDLTVTPVNDPPTLDTLTNLVLNEDAGTQAIQLTGIGSGAANEIQTLRVTAVSSNPSLIAQPQIDYASPSLLGTLRFSPLPDTNGVATITVTVDDGELENSRTSQSFTVSVTSVNDAPAVILTAPVIGSRFTAPANIVLSANVLDIDGTVTRVQFFQGATLIGEAASPPYRILWNSVPAGNYEITARAIDNEGLASTSSRVPIIVLGPPVLTPIPDQTIREDSPTVPIPFQVSDIHTPAANLILLAVSSNPGLLSQGGITLFGTDVNRTLVLRPARDQSGICTIILTATDSDGMVATNLFTVTVTPVNDAPTLDPLTSLVLDEDAGTQTIQLAGIGSGAANEVQTLRVTASSSNPGLIPQPQIDYSSPNLVGTLRFTPVPDANGVATITVTVDDGEVENSRTSQKFTVSVTSVNDAPAVILAAPAFGAQFVAPATVTLSATVLDLDGVVAKVQFFQDATLVAEVTSTPFTAIWSNVPAGHYNLTARAIDNEGLATTSSRVSIVVFGPPVLSPIPAQSTREDTPSAPISFQVSDLHTPASNLVVLATSSNPNLLPPNGISLSGSGTNRTLVLRPARDQSGVATIILTATDSERLVATNRFDLTVTPVNDPPTLDPLDSVTISEDAGVQIVQLTGISSGAPNEVQTLSVTARSSDPSLIPQPQVIYSSPNLTGALRFTPAPNGAGSAVITVTVEDGAAENSTATRTFTVSITPVNDAPSVVLLAPIEGAQFTAPASVFLSATPQDIDGVVSRVQFFQGATLIAEATAPPFNFLWSSVLAGTYALTARAIDNEGLAGTSASVSIVVIEPNRPPVLSSVAAQTTREDAPTGPITFQVTDSQTPASNLVVLATSSNPSLLPPSGISLSGNGTNRTLVLNPARDQSGGATIIVTARDPEGLAVTNRFDLTVTPVNDPPTLDLLADRALNEDAQTQTIPLTGISSGAANEVETLRVTVVSSNPTLIPQPQVIYSSPNTVGTLRFTPATNGNGSAVITVTVDDGSSENSSTIRSFTVSVASVNDAPSVVLSAPTNGAQFTAPAGILLSATVQDIDGFVARVQFFQGAALVGEATSPPFNALWSSVPAGAYTLTARAIDNEGLSSTSAPVSILVIEPNKPPVLSPIVAQTTREDTPSAPIPFQVTDTQTPASNLVVAATSLNLTLLPQSGINLSGTGTNRTLIPNPARDQYGIATIVVTARDPEGLATTNRFDLTVTPVNDPPTLDALASLVIDEDSGSQSIQLTGITTGATNELQILRVTVVSNVPALIPQPQITYTSPNPTGTLRFTPTPNGSGAAIITVTVDDGGLENASASRAFTVTVRPVNDPPTVSLTNPAAGAIFATPTNLTISANATDLDGRVALVEFFAGTNKVGTASASPFSIIWSNVSARTYVLTARATDDGGLSTTSAPVTITVFTPNFPPAVSILTPADGALFPPGTNINLVISASDPDGFVAGVDLYEGATLLASKLPPPYNFPWIDPPLGDYVLRAVATDNAGLRSTSAPVRIRVTADVLCNAVTVSVFLEGPTSPVQLFDTITYRLTVQTHGECDAVGVVLTNTLPSGLQFISAQASQGTFQFQNGILLAKLGIIRVSAFVDVTARPIQNGVLTNTAAVRAINSPRFDEGNMAEATILVIGTPPVLSLQTIPGQPLRLRLETSDNFSYRIETSVDLAMWLQLTNGVKNSWFMELTDALDPRIVRRFFRALKL